MMRRWHSSSMATALSGALALVLLLFPVGLALGVTMGQVATELMCTCGCTMVLDSCTCGTSDQMRAQIQKMIDGGQSKDQILGYYVSQFGEKILSAPTKKGFNLTAWVIPFVSVAAAAAVLYYVVSRWVAPARKREEVVTEQATVPSHNKYRRKLEEELKSLR